MRLALTFAEATRNNSFDDSFRPTLLWNKYYNNQEDAQEFFAQLLDFDNCRHMYSLFSGILSNYIICPHDDCNARILAHSSEAFTTFILVINNQNSIQNALNAELTEKEKMEDEFYFKYSTCQREGVPFKQRITTKLPKVLFIQLRRFFMERNTTNQTTK